MARKMLVLPPCLLSPYTVYRGALEKDLVAARGVRGLLTLSSQVEPLSYPCPELLLLGFPRPPAPREVYERLGMREVAEKIAGFIARVLSEEAPRRLVVVGVKGSPTCAAFTTTSGDPDAYPYELLSQFGEFPKVKRRQVARELSGEFSPAGRPGLLFELLQERVGGTYLEFDKDDIPGSLAALREALGSP